MSVVERTVEPLVPLMVMAYVPSKAEPELMVTVLLTLPLAAGVTVAGENEQLAPAGRPEQDMPTALEKPLSEVIVQIRFLLVPVGIDRVVVPQETLKSPVGGGAVTVRLIPAVRVVPPDVPSTFMVEVPVVAVLDAETVTVAVAEPLAAGVTEAGEKEQLTPAGRAEQARLTALAKLLIELTVQVVLVLPLRWTDRDAGLHEMEKSGVGALTVTATPTVRTRDPLVPVIWTVVVPPGAEPLAVRVMVLLTVPLAAGVTVAGEGEQVTPAGRPAQEMATALEKLLLEVTVQAVEPDPPCASETEVGLQEREKSGAGELMVREMPAVLAIAPLVPSTLMVEVPTVAVLEAVT